MPKYASLFEFQKQFPNEEACVRHLLKVRWPNGFQCPNCGHDDGKLLRGSKLIQCYVCRHQTSPTSGTLFHKTRTPLLIWFWMIYLLAQDKAGTCALKISKDLGMHYDTVWTLLHKIRQAMAKRDERLTLAGFLELDEAVIGPQARKPGRPTTAEAKVKPRKKRLGRLGKGRRKTQSEAIVIVERENAHAGNVVMKVIERTTYADVKELVQQRVEPGQWFKTDACWSHDSIRASGHRLTMEVMSGPKGCEELPVVHRVIALVKRWLIGRYHGVSERYLQCYLDEFCFRFNRRDKEHTLYQSLLRACILALPVQYAEVRR